MIEHAKPCDTCGASLAVNFGAFQGAVGRWADAAFPQSDGASILAHLREEVAELDQAFAAAADSFGDREDEARLMEEVADCVLLLLHLSHKVGRSLIDATMTKHDTNTDRTWETSDNGRGHWKHIGG